MSRDTIGDFLTIIRNGIMASKRFVVAPYSNLRFELAKILKEEGFIKDVIVEELNPIKKEIKILLKYVDSESVIHEITRISRPGKRHYAGVNELKPVIGGLGRSILTTSKGIMTDKKAKELSIGGEIICTIW
jgi:small subunit ribosomal protein S8